MFSHRKQFVVWTLSAALCCCLFGHLVSAATPLTRQQWGEQLKQDRAVVAARIARLSAEDSADEREDGQASADELQFLQVLDATYAQHQARLQQMDALKKELDDANTTLSSLDDYEPDESKPYSFLVLENLKDQQQQQEQRSDALTAEGKSAQQLVATARNAVRECENALRLARKESKNASGKGSSKIASAENDLQLASAKLHMRQAELEAVRLEGELSDTLKKQLEKKIEVVEKDTKFSSEDRDGKLEQFAAEASRLKAQRREAEIEFEQLTSREAKLLSDETNAAQRTKISADIRAAQQANQSRVVIIDQLLEYLESARVLWRQRYELANDKITDPDKVRRLRSDVDDFLEQLTAMTSALDQKRASVRRNLQAAVSEVAAVEEANADTAKLREVALRDYDDLCASSIERLRQLELPLTRFQDEVKARLSKLDSNWNIGWLDFASGVLDYEVAEVDEEPVTVSRVLLLVGLILLGMVVSYYASVCLARYVLPRLGLKPGSAVAVRSICLYLLCIVSGVLAFRLLNIPMTAFAFLGGAAAIAIGFGSQDVMNNFMSGIILLTEQPIRVGDVIQIYDSQCIVTHIGLRSTRLRNYQNHELIIPNTVLIEKQVTNLTLSDNLAQMVVVIEVDRTENIDNAMRIMSEIARNHPLVLKDREPVVLLKSADTYYLNFEIHFTIEFVDPMECLVVQSQILEGISKCFPTQSAEAETAGSAGNLDIPGAGNRKKIDRAQVEKEMKRLQALLRHSA